MSLPRPSGLPARSLAEVAERLGVPVIVPGGGSGDGPDDSSADLDRLVITGVTMDSRAVLPGDLYVAPAGSKAHGADFAGTAAEAGAVACLTDETGKAQATASGLPTYVVPSPRAVLGDLAAWLYGEPAHALTTIGVTGTNGKTTTAYLLESGLRAAGRTTGLVGTIETRIGDDVVPNARTTPEATDLQALLAVMRERGVDAVAMEVSSHALAMGRVDGMTYDVAVFTNLTEDHLDFHADLEDYFAVKASLFTPDRARVGVIDIDDPYGARLVGLAGVPVVTVSPSGCAADWRVEDRHVGPLGSSFTVVGPDGRRTACTTGLSGDFNLTNAALAVVALASAGVDVDVAAAGVGKCAGVPGRMERVGAGGSGPLALVDYAHSPDALERLLATARGLVAPGGRLVVVVGAGGDRDPHKRPAMGAIAVRDADLAVLTSDNPRSEDPLAIIAALRRGADEAIADGAHGGLEVEPDRRSAIGRAVAATRQGDVLVVAGKGHETGQEVNGVVHPFDDRVVLAEALAAGGPT
jgi:UDP-N-acetylmuramoyl-L-alanyl-D-glutamate--2,6-diaminopimelate ligase